MPNRFPTEAANDPNGRLNGMPESTGEDDILPENERGRALDREAQRERSTRDANRDESQRSGSIERPDR